MRRMPQGFKPGSRRVPVPPSNVRWSVIVPVKGTGQAKSRLGASADLAEAIALDSVDAVLRTASVERVVVVTSTEAAPLFEELGAGVVLDAGEGLNAACRQGIDAVDGGAVAVLLGDVPSLRPDELELALELAEHSPKSFVADADNDGTVLLAALNGSAHSPAFGAHSRDAHLAAGYVELGVPRDSGLRRDVDTSEQLLGIDPTALGVRTASALQRLI